MQSGTGRTCNSCGTVNEADASYCRSCGANLAGQTAPAEKASPSCPSCGGELPSQYAATCPSCGAFLSAYSVPPAAPVAQTMQPAIPPGYMQQPVAPAWTKNDGTALSNIRVYALIGIIGLVLSVASSVMLTSANFLNALFPSPTTTVALALSTVIGLTVLLLATVALWILSVVFARSAFGTLSNVDSNFHTPMSLTFLLYVGFPLFLTGLVITFWSELAFQNAPTSGSYLSILLIGVLMLFVALILLLLGEIGLLLGIWRFGSRYDETLFKAAVIMYIIPFVAVIAPLLVYVAAGSVRRKLQALLPPGEKR